jgi:hypothetical protein
MNDADSKRLSLLVPKELFDRFIEFSQKEYKNTTTQITDLMAGYVKAQEADSVANKQEAMRSVFSKSGEMIYKAIQGKQMPQAAQDNLAAIAGFLVDAAKHPEIFDDSEYLSRMMAVERAIRGE